MILSWAKDTTICLTIRDMKQGETISLRDAQNNQIGTAVITSVKVIKFGDLSEEDLGGHEKYYSMVEMYASFRKYYRDGVSLGATAGNKV